MYSIVYYRMYINREFSKKLHKSFLECKQLDSLSLFLYVISLFYAIKNIMYFTDMDFSRDTLYLHMYLSHNDR